MIREMKPSDIEQIMGLWLEGNIETHRFISAEYWKSNAPLVREQLLDAEVYVYEENGIIQGFAGIQGNYLAGIFIKKSVRSTGIGKRHICIRPYQDTYFAEMCKIHDPARPSELALAGLADAFLPLSIATEREGLFDYRVYVAEYDGAVTGFIAFSENEIAWLYVDTNYSRRGSAQACRATQCNLPMMR